MDDLVKAVGAASIVLGGLFVFIVASTLMGSVAGWIVGLFFSDIILGILDQLGIHGISMWQFGTFMGFIGGFLKTKTTVSSK